MLNTILYSVVFTTLLFVVSIPDVASYNKYGRSCKDIGCRSDEVCVIAEDPCTIYSQDKCGHYPTCKKMNAGGTGCASIVCQSNEYCKTENGVPKCVSKVTSNGFESAGVDVVNGQRVSSSDTNKHINTNTNPYANANAPPLPADPVSAAGSIFPVNSGDILDYLGSHGNAGIPKNNGYPSYPSTNQGNQPRTDNLGYPLYPSTNQGNQPRTDNLGYPPYPTQNRMPQPGHGYPPYPGQAGYPQMEYPQQYPNGQRYPVGNYPGYPNYPNQNHRVFSQNSNSIYRKNSSASFSASVVVVCLINLSMVLINWS